MTTTRTEETTMDVRTAIDSLTAKGTETMTSIGNIAYGKRELGFFDNGVTAGSGSWGECLTGELGHRSSGVINRLAKLGLFETSWDDNGTWFELTELGAAVALELAAPPADPSIAESLATAAEQNPVFQMARENLARARNQAAAAASDPGRLIADQFVEITEPVSGGVTVSPPSAAGPGGRSQPVNFVFGTDDVQITFQGVATRVMSWGDWEFIARVYGKRRA